jgi:hypothetical protein
MKAKQIAGGASATYVAILDQGEEALSAVPYPQNERPLGAWVW